MIDFRMRVFCKAAEKLNFSEAAQELFLTQPAVTFQIKKLEAHFGTLLFYREKNRVSLTEAGGILLKQARKILSCYEEAERMIAKISGKIRGRVVVGASTTIGEYILPSVLGDFMASYPDVETYLSIGNSDQILNGVVSRKFDIGILAEKVENRDLYQEKILEDELVLIASPKSPLSRLRTVAPGDLRKHRFIVRERGSGTRKETETWLKSAGLDPLHLRISMVLGSSEAIKGAVEANLGVAILSRSTIQKELKLGTLQEVPIRGIHIVRDFKLIHYKWMKLSPRIEAFVDFLKTSALHNHWLG